MNRSQLAHARSRSWPLAAAVVLACTVGCGNGDGAVSLPEGVSPPANPAADPAEKTGSLSFALTTQNGAKFDSFSYTIIGPDFSRSASIDVSNSTTVSGLIEGIPAGSGYSITLMGTSAPPVVATCSGSAPFAVTAGTVTSVPVSLACHLADQPPPASVPIPPLVPVALGFILLLIGTTSARRRERSG